VQYLVLPNIINRSLLNKVKLPFSWSNWIFFLIFNQRFDWNYFTKAL